MSNAHAPIAQLDRVTDYESVGRGFESLSAYQKYQIPFQVSGIFIYARKDSKNEMLGSGGALLAAGLDGGNTLLCATGAKATSPIRRTKKSRYLLQVSSFFIYDERDANDSMRRG